jgi:xanthine dehydrogenase accessory factor
MIKLIDSILKKLDSGSAMVLVSIIASSGSTPRGAGATMAVFEDGSSLGTIGGGAVEYEAQKQAKDIIKEKTSKMASYRLAPNDVADLGMICGGDVTVYYHYVGAGDEKGRALFAHIKNAFAKDESSWLVRRFENDVLTGMGVYDGDGLHYMETDIDLKPYLTSQAEKVPGEPFFYIEPLKLAGNVYIFGGGHVAQELVPVLSHVEFETVVFEDRENFARKSLFKGVSDVILGDFSRFSDYIEVKPEDYIIIMTRGHQADYTVLGQALRTQASYIGCIGSSRKTEAIKKRLIEEEGIEKEAFQRLFSPIGLEIMAETPAEIAVSIAAQLIMHRAKTRGGK